MPFLIARVAVFLPISQLFDYLVPAPLVAHVAEGVRVWVPYGPRAIEGVVWTLEPAEPQARRAISRVIDAPPLRTELLDLARWMVDYYLAPPGEVLRLFLSLGGRAQARRRVRLSEKGKEWTRALERALVPSDVAALDSKERALLVKLASRPRSEAALASEVEGARSALARLVERGLIEVHETVRAGEAPTERVIHVAREPRPGELDRAPQRAALFELLRQKGPMPVASLREQDPRRPARLSALLAALLAAGLVREERVPRRRDFGATPPPDEPPALTEEQGRALARIEEALAAGRYAPFLLHGVTGSGKTEVYLRAIAATLKLGRTALVLVPEIALTPQLTERFRARFGDEVAVLHSGLADAERKEAWRRLEQREVRIALGARSAVFAPIANLGILVVDEEHDSSFKQEEGVRYHGRDVALRRARGADAVAVLGSATPSVETFAAAKEGRLTLLSLRYRATRAPMPVVELVDLRQHRLPEGRLLSGPLEDALGRTLAASEQAILFLNRRGFATFILCRGCGTPLRCNHCSVTLTYHRKKEQLSCHYCGFASANVSICPSCGQRSLERLGYGTEQVEAQVKALFPHARVGRMDRDTAEGDGLLQLLGAVRRRELDVVVGTQMVSKGHDFPQVTLVGVVLADLGMGLPDFRASERTYQLLEQVAGRAGRAERPGRVIIQTYSPFHPAVTCARAHEYERFFDRELADRQELGFPPWSRLACVRLDGVDPAGVQEAARSAAAAARQAALRAPAEEALTVMGPAEAPLSRLKGRTRWQLFVRARTVRALRVVIRAALERPPRAVRIAVDVDPVSML